jgi:hypothetical protein
MTLDQQRADTVLREQQRGHQAHRAAAGNQNWNVEHGLPFWLFVSIPYLNPSGAVGWAKTRSAVPTMVSAAVLLMVGTLLPSRGDVACVWSLSPPYDRATPLH